MFLANDLVAHKGFRLTSKPFEVGLAGEGLLAALLACLLYCCLLYRYMNLSLQ